MQKIDLQEIQRRMDANFPPQSGPEPRGLAPDHPVWEVWIRLAEMYASFVATYGESPSDTWVRGLESLSNQQLARGLEACSKRNDSFPPNLGEFRTLCTTFSRAHVPYVPQIGWQKTPATDAVKAEEMAKIRALLGGEK
jgi:hypothetical protein